MAMASASGGIGSLDDLRALKRRAHKNIAGAICGLSGAAAEASRPKRPGAG